MENKKRKLTTEEFIERAKSKHGDKYDYSNTTYYGKFKKLIITCPIHGEFEQEAWGHIKGKGCITCSGYKPLTTEEFIERAKSKHGDKYDYTISEFISVRSLIKITCPIHGEFEQKANSHLHGRGCKKCAGFGKSREEFIYEAKTIHGNKYDYTNMNYDKTKINITCKKHGEFILTKGNHIHGKQGCPICSEPKGEKIIRVFLDENNISYKRQKTYPDCKYKKILQFDFYIPDLNILLEFDGIQHFKIVEFFGGKKGFIERKKCDEIKNKYCSDNDIPLHRISYTENILKRLDEIFGK